MLNVSLFLTKLELSSSSCVLGLFYKYHTEVGVLPLRIWVFVLCLFRRLDLGTAGESKTQKHWQKAFCFAGKASSSSPSILSPIFCEQKQRERNLILLSVFPRLPLSPRSPLFTPYFQGQGLFCPPIFRFSYFKIFNWGRYFLIFSCQFAICVLCQRIFS